jgi:hypothetical protein
MIVDELVLVPIHQDVADLDGIYSLNEVGAFIWEKLANPIDLQELKNALLEEFEVDEGIVMEDVQTFLAELSEFGAVKKCD